jgi:hypothetical protein
VKTALNDAGGVVSRNLWKRRRGGENANRKRLDERRLQTKTTNARRASRDRADAEARDFCDREDDELGFALPLMMPDDVVRPSGNLIKLRLV